MEIATKGFEAFGAKLNDTKKQVEGLHQGVLELSEKGLTAFEEKLEGVRREMDQLNHAVRTGTFAAFVKESKELEKAERFARLRAELGNFGARLTLAGEAVQKFQQRFASITDVVVRPLALATAAVTGFAVAGLRGTVQAEALAFHMERLSRAVADIFAPLLNQLIGVVERLANWFRGLSDGTKDLIANLTLAGLAALTVLTILPKLVGAVSLVITAIQALTVAFAGLNVMTGGLLIVIGLLVTALAAFSLGTERGRRGLGAIWDATRGVRAGFAALADAAVNAADAIGDRWDKLADQMDGRVKSKFQNLKETIQAAMAALIVGPLLPFVSEPDKKSQRPRVEPAGGGFEQIEATFRRVQLASLKADLGAKGKSVEEQQLEVQRMQLAEQQKTNEKLGGIKPAVSF